MTAALLFVMLFQTTLPALTEEVYVANISSNEVTVYDGSTGVFKRVFVEAGSGGLSGATGLAFGPDGDLYVSSSRTNKVLRYDGETGSFKEALVEDPELSAPFSLIFGPDGNLYVSSGRGHTVRRYHGHSGEFLNTAASHPDLWQPIGLAFGSDKMLYVVNSGGKNVMRFDPKTGKGKIFASDSLAYPSDLAFGPDGGLYVSNAANGTIVRFDGDSGRFDGVYARLPKATAPVGLAFTGDGKLFVAGFAVNVLYLIAEPGGVAEAVSDKGLAGPENITIRRF